MRGAKTHHEKSILGYSGGLKKLFRIQLLKYMAAKKIVQNAKICQHSEQVLYGKGPGESL